MKRKAVVALMLGVALAATGCGQKETKKTTEVATETKATETEAATEEATTEAATEEATTEETTTEAATEEATTEAATEEATTEAAATKEVTTEEATEEATTEVATEETTTEAATEEATTEEAATEETTTEAATEEATTEEATTEAESETETETEAVTVKDMPSYNALDYVTLGDYKEVEAVQEPLDEVTDEEVEAEISARIDGAQLYDTLTEGTVENGDLANIDYKGTLDGVAFDGGTAEGYDLAIGSGTFIPGFEEGLVGIAVGEETDLNLTFPENYGNAELSGKEVVFHVKVNSIQRQPEFTDEVASKLEEGKTAEEYTADVRAELEEEALIFQQNALKAALLQIVTENAEIKAYPQEKIDWYLEYQKSYYVSMSQMYGMEFIDFLTATGYESEEAFLAKVEEYYKPTLAQEMVLMAIAETEGIEISEEEFKEGLQKYADDMSKLNGAEVTAEEILEQYGETYVRDSLTLDKTMEFLVEHASIVEENATEAESETETETAAETESETETETTAETESETETEAAAETESETETETTAETESETETETATETESETETETAAEA